MRACSGRANGWLPVTASVGPALAGGGDASRRRRLCVADVALRPERDRVARDRVDRGQLGVEVVRVQDVQRAAGALGGVARPR